MDNARRQAKVYQRSLHKALWHQVIGDIHCEVCGYDKCFNALEAHHRDPATKVKNISSILSGPCSTQAKREYSEEIKKCSWLCANCHRELHSREQEERDKTCAARPQKHEPDISKSEYEIAIGGGYLTADERVIANYVMRGLSRKDICALTGMSAGALRIALFRIRGKRYKSEC